MLKDTGGSPSTVPTGMLNELSIPQCSSNYFTPVANSQSVESDGEDGLPCFCYLLLPS